MMPESSPTLVIDQRLDARGWLCPRPVIEAQRLLLEMSPVAVLEVLLTDPHGALDFAVLCQRRGYCLHEVQPLAEQYHGTAVWRVLLSRQAGSATAAR